MNCRNLWGTCKDIPRTIFLLFCDGIFGTIEALVVDETFRYESVILPIKKLSIVLTREELDDIKFSPEEKCVEVICIIALILGILYCILTFCVIYYVKNDQYENCNLL